MATINEVEAQDALNDALKALQRVREMCDHVGYSSQVRVPLTNAHRELQYALDTAMTRGKEHEPAFS